MKIGPRGKNEVGGQHQAWYEQVRFGGGRYIRERSVEMEEDGAFMRVLSQL